MKMVNTTYSVRQSNMELLRIISMFFIVLEHILIIGTDFFSLSGSLPYITANSLVGFTYIGVNCFILITGYFGAEFTWKRLMNLYLTCCFYELVGFLFAYSKGIVELSTTTLSFILFPLSHSGIWFVRSYVVLLLLLPIINAGMAKLDKRQFVFALIALTVLNLYFGWFQKQVNFNADGYNASQMIYLYVIGRYLNLYVEWDRIRSYRHYLLLSWVVLSLLWGMVQNINDCVFCIPHWNGWAYNNPIVIISAICFFSFFRCLEITPSSIINLFGGTMFGVLLIHINRYIDVFYFVHKILSNSAISNNFYFQVFVVLVLAGGMVLVFSIIDMLRLYVHKKVMKVLNRFCSNLHIHTHTYIGEINLKIYKIPIFNVQYQIVHNRPSL